MSIEQGPALCCECDTSIHVVTVHSNIFPKEFVLNNYNRFIYDPIGLHIVHVHKKKGHKMCKFPDLAKSMEESSYLILHAKK